MRVDLMCAMRGAALASLVALGAGAPAAAFSLEVSKPLNVLVAPDATYDGVFDIGSQLAGYNVVGGTIISDFSDNQDIYIRTFVYFTDWQRHDVCRQPDFYFNCVRVETLYYTRSAIFTEIDPIETMMLATGGSSAVASSSSFIDPFFLEAIQTGTYAGKPSYTYDRVRRSGWTGDFEARLELNADMIDQINATGKLPFSISSVSGDAYATGVRAVLDLEPVAVIPAPPAGALLLSCVAAVGLLRRRRRTG